MKTRSSALVPAIEVLEARIAPANIFFNPTGDDTIRSYQGFNKQAVHQSPSSATIAGADHAVLLSPGDKLYVDSTPTFVGKKTKRHQVVDTNDSVLLLTVSQGTGLAFLTDLDGDDVFDTGELTGLILGNKFRGQAEDVSGSVATAKLKLPAPGEQKGMAVITNSSIESLTVTGSIGGHLLAGNSLAGIDIQSAPDTGFSVESIATGSATSGLDVFFGRNNLTTGQFVPNAKGGDISDVTLAHGTATITAGDGADRSAGGSVKGIAITTQAGELQITAGKGGFGGEILRKGLKAGDGGDIDGVVIESQVSGSVALTAGEGGYGGYVEGVGDDDDSYFGGSGGRGGNVSDVTITLAASPTPFARFDARGGNGGEGQIRGNGGNGGSVEAITVSGDGVVALAKISGGNAGLTSAAGGNGGDVTDIELDANSLEVYGGSGSESGTAADGGDGGSISGLTLSEVSGSVTLVAGESGYAGYTSIYRNGDYLYNGADGGDGGSISNISITGTGSGVGANPGFRFIAGSGNYGSIIGNGGAGGSITSVSISLSGNLSALSMLAGMGGTADEDPELPGADGGIGGDGGSITGIFVSAESISGIAELIGGAGGSGGFEGGNGGSLESVTLQAGQWLSEAPTFEPGAGGGGSQPGAPGSITDVSSDYPA